MNIGQIYSFFSQQVIFIWLLVFITPLYVFMASILGRGIQWLYNMAINKQSLIYTNIGDVSWLFPFKQNEQEFKLIHTLFLAIMLAIASLIVLGGIMLLNFIDQKRIEDEKRQQREKNRRQQRNE